VPFKDKIERSFMLQSRQYLEITVIYPNNAARVGIKNIGALVGERMKEYLNYL